MLYAFFCVIKKTMFASGISSSNFVPESDAQIKYHFHGQIPNYYSYFVLSIEILLIHQFVYI